MVLLRASYLHHSTISVHQYCAAYHALPTVTAYILHLRPLAFNYHPPLTSLRPLASSCVTLMSSSLCLTKVGFSGLLLPVFTR